MARKILLIHADNGHSYEDNRQRPVAALLVDTEDSPDEIVARYLVERHGTASAPSAEEPTVWQWPTSRGYGSCGWSRQEVCELVAWIGRNYVAERLPLEGAWIESDEAYEDGIDGPGQIKFSVVLDGEYSQERLDRLQERIWKDRELCSVYRFEERDEDDRVSFACQTVGTDRRTAIRDFVAKLERLDCRVIDVRPDGASVLSGVEGREPGVFPPVVAGDDPFGEPS